MGANPHGLLPLWGAKKYRELGRVARWLVVFVPLLEGGMCSGGHYRN